VNFGQSSTGITPVTMASLVSPLGSSAQYQRAVALEQIGTSTPRAWSPDFTPPPADEIDRAYYQRDALETIDETYVMDETKEQRRRRFALAADHAFVKNSMPELVHYAEDGTQVIPTGRRSLTPAEDTAITAGEIPSLPRNVKLTRKQLAQLKDNKQRRVRD
jgi:hypothetical protein